MSNLDDTTTTTTALDDPSLNALPDDETISVDWDAQERESGGFKPRIMPGSHNFTFHLEDQRMEMSPRTRLSSPLASKPARTLPRLTLW